MFAALALVLAGIGIYGVLAYMVSQRTNEIGLRVALGAQTRDVLKMALGQGLVLTVIGALIGLFSAFAVTRVLTSLLFGVKANDPVTFASVALLVILIALFASYVPARRAAKVDPIVALRYE